MVFSLYFIVTLTVTAVHMYIDYSLAKDEVMKELIIFENTFKQGLSNEVWNLDYDELSSIVHGMIEVPSIIGVSIHDDRRESLISTGWILENSGAPKYFAYQYGEPQPIPERMLGVFFKREFPLVFMTEDGKRHDLGYCTLYSSSAVVFDKVKYNFFMIVFNSIIKTVFLWLIFLYIGRSLLGKPLAILSSFVKKLSLGNLENLKVDVQTSGRNELQVLEDGFNTMIQKLILEKNRIISFRRFSSKIPEFKDSLQTLRFVFHEVCNHVSVSNAAYYYDIYSPGQTHQELLYDNGKFLKTAITNELLEHCYVAPNQQVVVYNTIGAENPLTLFYKKFGKTNIQGGHVVLIRKDASNVNLICLYRSEGQPPFSDSDIEYIKSMISEVRIISESVDHVRKNARMESELQTAAAIQNTLLPKSLPHAPHLELADYYQSATETGGDWYGFTQVIDGVMYLAIGDVTGHGTPAALIAATASATCRLMEENHVAAKKRIQVTEFLQTLNRAIYRVGNGQYLMTFFLAGIDLTTGKITFSNAGHNFPILMRANGKLEHLKNSGTPLGVQHEMTYTENYEQLLEGDTLYLYTDGVIENVNSKGKIWGIRDFRKFLRKYSQLPVKQMVDEFTTERKNFYARSPLEDDITLVACKVVKPF